MINVENFNKYKSALEAAYTGQGLKDALIKFIEVINAEHTEKFWNSNNATNNQGGE